MLELLLTLEEKTDEVNEGADSEGAEIYHTRCTNGMLGYYCTGRD